MYVVNQPNDQITKNIKSIMASIFSHIFFTSPPYALLSSFSSCRPSSSLRLKRFALSLRRVKLSLSRYFKSPMMSLICFFFSSFICPLPFCIDFFFLSTYPVDIGFIKTLQSGKETFDEILISFFIFCPHKSTFEYVQIRQNSLPL